MTLDVAPQGSETSASEEVGRFLVFLSDETLFVPDHLVAMSVRLISLFDKYSIPFYAGTAEALPSNPVLSAQSAFRFMEKSESRAIGRSILTLFDTWLNIYAPMDTAAVFPEEEQLMMRQLLWDFNFMLVGRDLSYDDWNYERSVLTKCMLLPQEQVARWSMAELQDGHKFRVERGWKYLW